VTYTAPSSPPASNLSVTITAASMTDARQSGSTSVTVLAITVSVSPGSGLIPINITQQFSATVQNDPTNQGVNWTTSQAGTSCTSGCGALAPSGTASGAATTYTAPATVPTNAKVTLTATSATDTTKSAGATVTVSNGTVKIVPNSLDFGTVKNGQTGSMTTTLTNTANTTLTISNASLTGTNPGDFSLGTNGCGTSVTAGSSCNLTVTFKPTQVGTFSASLSISDSSTDSPQEVNLSGTGASRPRGPELASALTVSKVRTVPRPTGPSAVGTRVLRLVDSTREDPFLANRSKRELLVRLWYPAEGGENCTRAEYAPAQVWRYFSRLLEVALPQVTTNSCWNAAVADGAHPIVVFTPGFTATFTDYSFIFEDLASRGYVVASVDHTFEATAVEFPDGRFVPSVFGSHLGSIVRGDEQALNLAVSIRLSDLQFVVNELERISTETSGPFAGKLDVSRLALAGHSLGGLATILGVEGDPRFRAGIVLDGAMPHSMRETETPMLMLATGRDEWSEEERQLWDALHGPRLAVNLRGTEHLTASDAVWLAAGAVKTGTMGPEKTMAAIRDFIAAFLDANLLGKPPDALLTGASREYPDATVTTQTQLLHAKN
jgi:dienelactone hydrolase